MKASAVASGLLPVTMDDVGPTNEQLANPALGVGPVDGEIHHGHRETHGVGVLGGLRVWKERRQRRGLGQAEAVAHARVGEGAFDLVNEALGDRGATV